MTIAIAGPVPDVRRWPGAAALRGIVRANLAGERAGIYSVCCSHPLAIEAAVDQALADGTSLLVEATANQVNQFGGYTGMRPTDFAEQVRRIATRRGLGLDKVILGGDHLGPVCWTGEAAEQAMAKAEDLVAAFAAAGFEKLHLDCSMPCADDAAVLDDETVSARAARLCAVAERSARAAFGDSGITYVIGTEVPPPGGADETLHAVEVTPVDRARRTLQVHRDVFARRGLSDAWDRVIAMVVQPGVEFDHSAVVDYVPARASDLATLPISGEERVAFEAHSTDYQLPAALASLVRDHFAILKVGPGLTFALREALFALSHVEDELVEPGAGSRLRAVCEERMVAEPRNWQRFYDGDAQTQTLLRRFSLSDRIRYYWPDPVIDRACARLFANLADAAIPFGLLHQYLPDVAMEVRAGRLDGGDPVGLVKAHIRRAILPYVAACAPQVGS